MLGGGYAALAAIHFLSRHAPQAQLTLVAPRKAHIKTCRLHESLRHSLRRYCVLYSELGKRFPFQFIQAKLQFSPDSLLRWQQQRYLRIDERRIPFDFLIIATGARCAPYPRSPGVFTLDDFFLNRGQSAIGNLCEHRGGEIHITVVGSGATGVQFLFELSTYLQQRAQRRHRLCLVGYEPRLLTQFPTAFHDYAAERLRRHSIEWLPATEFMEQLGRSVRVKPREQPGERTLPSDLTLLLSGVRPTPITIATNEYGQVVVDHAVLERIFAAGDCARFQGSGSNALSAQVAMRKGTAVAANILGLCAQTAGMAAYAYREQGYIVSLGPGDAIGWLGTPDRVISGLRASALKAAVERQYDLLLAGVDTFGLAPSA